jgi:hypothetical protein
VIYAGELDILCPLNVPGEVSAILDIDGQIACAVQNQRGHSDCRKHVSNIDAMAHKSEGLGSPWTSTCPFRPPNKFAQLFITSQTGHEPIN